MNLFSFSEYIIRKDNLINNINILKGKILPGVEFYSVVKADAYGVGAQTVAKIVEPFVDGFAVANLNEGIELRLCGITKDILVLGAINFDEIDEYSCYKIKPSVNSFFDLSKLSSDVKKPTMVEFGLNTGMNRFGFCEKSEIFDAIAILNHNSKIELVGAYSHLSTKEDDIDFIYKQKEKFDEFLSVINLPNIKFHLSNTNAILNHQDLNYDRVRCGFGQYGMDKNSFGLKPVVEIKSRVVHIEKVKKGQSVGYDRTYTSKKDTLIAVVPLGYYDGINRRVSNFGKVLINGKFASIVGRVCMDAMMVDVTNISGVSRGSKVTILGSEKDKSITISDYASWSDTSSYESFVRFNRARMKEVVCY